MATSHDHKGAGLEPLRALGCSESFYATTGALGLPWNVIVSARYIAADLVSSIDRATLYRALHRVVPKYPALCLQIDLEKSVALRLSHINLDEVVQEHEGKGGVLEAVFVQQIASSFVLGVQTPLWKLVLLPDGTIVFVGHHAFIDGRSGMNFHQALLAALRSSTPTETPSSAHLVTCPSQLSLPSIEDTMDIGMSVKVIWTMLKMFPTPWHPSSSAWTGNRYPPAPHTRAVVQIHRLAAHNAESLLRLCRQHHCTLTGFLHTLGTYVLSHLIGQVTPAEGAWKKFKHLSVTVNVDLRRFAKVADPSALEINNFASGHQSYEKLYPKAAVFPPNATSFPWTHAAAQSEMLRTVAPLRSKDNMAAVRLTVKQGLVKPGVEHSFGRPRNVSLELSNIGPTLAPTPAISSAGPGDVSKKTWQMDDLVFCACEAAFGPALRVNVVGSPCGAINFTYAWGEDAVDAALGELFVQEMENVMLAISTSEV